MGNYGETLACEHLEKNGYLVLERNFHSRHGEIDIIARKDEYLVFIEVKTRRRPEAFHPSLSVTKSRPQNPGNGSPIPFGIRVQSPAAPV